MLLAFIILLVVANSGLIYADSNQSSTENLFTQSADDLPGDSVNTSENSSDNIINTNDADSNSGNINNINQTENQNNVDSSSNDSIDSNSGINTTDDNSDYNSQTNNSNNNISEEANDENNNTLPVSLATESNTVNTQADSNKITVKSLSASVNSINKLSKEDIIIAAMALTDYIEKFGKLPDYLTLFGEKLSMSDLLYLLSKSVVNTNSGSSADITIKDVKDPSGPSGTVTNGKLSKSGYVDLAKRVVSYIESNNRAPNYGSSSLGNIKFQSMIYGFAKIINFVGTENRLPNYVTFEKGISTSLNKVMPKYSGVNGLIIDEDSSSDNNTTNNTGNNSENNNSSDVNNGSSNSSNSGTISLANIKDAGARIEAYVNANGVLPNYVEIGGKQYSMTDFLYLAVNAILNINKGSNSGITAKTFKNATSPTGSSINGNIYKKDFVDLASRVSAYMLKNGQAPNYGSSSLGKMQFQTMVLAFSKVLEFAKSEGRLPNYLTLNVKSTSSLNGGNQNSGGDSGSGSIPTGPLNEKNTLSASELVKYLQATTNCQVNNAAIQSLAASLTKNSKTELEKATAIFNYVRDNIDYVYYTNTKKGAVGTLNAKSGNCVDQAHLLIALFRASGLEARYVHADCTFTVSGRIGHVFAQVLVGDTWVVADPTHSANSLGKITNWNVNTYTLKGQGKSVSINF
ncbi:transglutaminase domain-containing protein [Methanobrevibacter sp. TMH8]|uniref:transglutaminase domain-containing protein n=1 Tax=Methanobrevibacter sp. TMH8 TaxID=2848611 RepID=UPI001CCBFDB5|nr:transglutaminase domain-containing protein [Methanobrevibacter sp. TMH8]MBZ9571508.1 transglutaminase domain-containing protein [Methanobrevibacter sp. TMH8]